MFLADRNGRYLRISICLPWFEYYIMYVGSMWDSLNVKVVCQLENK
jgi:hypothetical protein